MKNPFKISFSRKAKTTILLIILGALIFAGIAGYKTNEYFANNPKACMLCHVHDEAQKMWAKSKHASVNCHECHHTSKREQIEQVIKVVFLQQKSVTPRHGEVIVPWKLCITCHWDRNEKYPNAAMVNKSQYHAKHVFMEKIECSKCHGYITHEFPTAEKFCVRCHSGKEVHGTGMEDIACLNCHTDLTKNLIPPRKKCLYCHGDKSVRTELIATGTIDVKRFQPSEALLKKAIKIKAPADAPMQFPCYTCHKPHSKIRPDYGDCLVCHKQIPQVGKHGLHINMADMKCKDCHKPHSWRVTEASAKKDCTKCHEYREPMKFIGP